MLVMYSVKEFSSEELEAPVSMPLTARQVMLKARGSASAALAAVAAELRHLMVPSAMHSWQDFHVICFAHADAHYISKRGFCVQCKTFLDLHNADEQDVVRTCSAWRLAQPAVSSPQCPADRKTINTALYHEHRRRAPAHQLTRNSRPVPCHRQE